MKFYCSKIKINGKEVSKSCLFGRKLEWRKDGTKAVKRRIKKNGKGLKKSNCVVGVLWYYLWDSPTAILHVRQGN